ncbi:MAG: PAS domain-containing protein, partial [Ideonella sp.]|nr:PAS domain-containing protein [Ideonella sp.]
MSSPPAPPPARRPGLSELAPEVASTVVRVAGDIALVIGADGLIRSVAEGNLPLHAERDAWVGRPWADTVSAHTRNKVALLLEEAQRHGVSRRRELNHPSGEGGEIPVSWAAVRLGDDGPVLAVGRDLRAVSAIQQRFLDAQQELERGYWQRRQTESHYRLLFQVAHDAVVVLDAETLLVREANPSAVALFAPPSGSFAGKLLRHCIDDAVRPAFDELLSTSRATGRAGEVRLRVAQAGTPIDLAATPFRAEGQHCLLLRARRAEPSAVDPQTVLDFIGQTPDAVVVTDSRGGVLWANPAFVALCDAPSEAHLKGRSLGEALGGDPAHQWATLLARVRARGVVGRVELNLQWPGAAPMAVDVSAALLEDGDQEHIGFTLRPLAGTVAADGTASVLADELGALVGQLGSAPLPELLAAAARRIEHQLVDTALRSTAGQLDAAARVLQIPLRDLLERAERLGIPLPEPTGREGRPPLVN